MKKTICTLFALFLFASVCAAPASALDSAAPRYLDAFQERLKDGCGTLESFEELYYHKVNGETDWALVHGKGSWELCWCVFSVLGDRVLSSGTGDLPFEYDYGIYDVQQKQFISIEEAFASGDYPDLPAVMDDLNIGRRRGDMDNDGKLTIQDATALQRCLAEFSAFPQDNSFEGINLSEKDHPRETVMISDADSSGVTDINDVTEIQRILASE